MFKKVECLNQGYESDESGSEWEEEGSEIRNFLDAFDNEDFEWNIKKV